VPAFAEGEERRKVLQGGHAATLQRTLGKRDCSQNDKKDRGRISLFSEMVNPPPAAESAQFPAFAASCDAHTALLNSGSALVARSCLGCV
jgi:hypothetical protein